MNTRTCSKCGIVGGVDYFFKDRRSLSGFQSSCKNCQTNIQKKYVQRNKHRYKITKDKYGFGAGTIARFGFRLALLVYERARRKCEMCGEKNDLTIHHKDRNGRNNEEKNIPVNNDPKNLMVVCRGCHGSIHGKQSRGIPRPNRRKR